MLFDTMARDALGRLHRLGDVRRLLIHSAQEEAGPIALRLRRHGWSAQPRLHLLTASSECLRHPPGADPCRDGGLFQVFNCDHATPPALVSAIQNGQEASGIDPVPGLVLRGEAGGGVTLVLTEGDRVVGSVSLLFVPDMSVPSTLIFALWIDPRVRGRRLAGWLHWEAGQVAAARGASRLMYIAEKKDGPAARLCALGGFQFSATSQFQFFLTQEGDHGNQGVTEWRSA